MERNKSPYSHGMIFDKIELPHTVTTFFQQRNKFVRGLPSYEQIEGREPYLPEEVKEDTMFSKFNYEKYPISNLDFDDSMRAEGHAIDLASVFTRNRPRDISKVSRDYMLIGFTKPIRIGFKIENKTNSAVYVKRPSIERIFGSCLYSLLSCNQCQDFVFNNYSFVEKEISGTHLDNENKRILTKRHKFVDSAIRLATLDDFMSISDLERVSGPKNTLSNILVQYDGSMEAFDFNTILQPYVKFKKNPFLEQLREMKIDISEKREEEISSDEAKRLNYTLEKKKPLFNALVNLMDRVPYMKERVEEQGYDSVKEYFKHSREKLKAKIK